MKDIVFTGNSLKDSQGIADRDEKRSKLPIG